MNKKNRIAFLGYMSDVLIYKYIEYIYVFIMFFSGDLVQ